MTPNERPNIEGLETWILTNGESFPHLITEENLEVFRDHIILTDEVLRAAMFCNILVSYSL